ncbi:unnamed protein product [Moneuplotes crassus]|uniref:Uncharacterized protein n=1 Tax=Euplotes crassus TaxID=5936 RepID=A0AAD2D5V5_EUPCR|nr:unnamed protein product [Moneuplotes crassus]
MIGHKLEYSVSRKKILIYFMIILYLLNKTGSDNKRNIIRSSRSCSFNFESAFVYFNVFLKFK